LERAASSWELLAESWPLTAKGATRKRPDVRRALSSWNRAQIGMQRYDFRQLRISFQLCCSPLER
jgi:hypothetical protein